MIISFEWRSFPSQFCISTVHAACLTKVMDLDTYPLHCVDRTEAKLRLEFLWLASRPAGGVVGQLTRRKAKDIKVRALGVITESQITVEEKPYLTQYVRLW